MIPCSLLLSLSLSFPLRVFRIQFLSSLSSLLTLYEPARLYYHSGEIRRAMLLEHHHHCHHYYYRVPLTYPLYYKLRIQHALFLTRCSLNKKKWREKVSIVLKTRVKHASRFFPRNIKSKLFPPPLPLFRLQLQLFFCYVQHASAPN